jgi:hypothetical protein
MSQSKRAEELKPYIQYIRDYDKLINLEEKEYQKELSEIRQGAIEHLKSKENNAPEIIRINEEFLKSRPLSYSSLKSFRKSPKHYIDYITKERKPPTESQILGSAFEIAMFEPDLWTKKVYVYEKPNLRSNAGKEEWEQIKTRGQGMIMITEDQDKTIGCMVESVKACDEMMRYINGIESLQNRLKWVDKKTGIPFIGYEDAAGTVFDEAFSFEVKTTKSADPAEFVRDYYKFEYNLQTGTYSEGYKRTKFMFPNFMVLAFETSEPYNCSPFLVENKTLEAAKEEWRNSVDAFKFCMDNEMFDKGYEFLLQSMDYFALRQPAYYKPRF